MTFWESFMNLFSRRASTEHKPDVIRGQLTIALQANERASQNVRAALEDMLEASDRARGVLIAASEKVRECSQ